MVALLWVLAQFTRLTVPGRFGGAWCGPWAMITFVWVFADIARRVRRRFIEGPLVVVLIWGWVVAVVLCRCGLRALNQDRARGIFGHNWPRPYIVSSSDHFGNRARLCSMIVLELATIDVL